MPHQSTHTPQADLSRLHRQLQLRLFTSLRLQRGHPDSNRRSELGTAFNAHPSQKVIWYLVTDSVHLREEAVKAFPDGKVVVSGFHPQHLELAWTDVARGLGGVEPVEEAKGLDTEAIRSSLDGMMETVAENW